MDIGFAGPGVSFKASSGGYLKLMNAGTISGFLPILLGVFGSWRETLQQDRLANMSPIYMDLIRKAQAEAQPGARR